MATPLGRDVWAIPGRVDHPMSRGTHRLLREGAELVEDPEEILRNLGLHASPVASEHRADSGDAPATSAIGKAVLATLRGETLTAEQISGRVGHPLTTVLVEVVSLEMAGAVARTPGGLYRRIDLRG